MEIKACSSQLLLLKRQNILKHIDHAQIPRNVSLKLRKTQSILFYELWSGLSVTRKTYPSLHSIR